jgi:hypothetical protein
MEDKILKVTFSNTSKTENISIRAIKLDVSKYKDVNFYATVDANGQPVVDINGVNIIKMIREDLLLSEQEEDNAENA